MNYSLRFKTEFRSQHERSSVPNPQPLNGIHVIECGHMVAAAYAAKLMADLGAEVIKVEEPGGDEAHRRGPYPGHVPHPEKSGTFLYLNTNKLGVTLNLRTPKGQELLQRLVQDADLLIYGGQLGLSQEELGELKAAGII